MEEIKKFFEGVSPMSNSDWDFFSSKLEMVHLNKNRPLLKVGEVENYLSFVSKGVIRLYIPREENDLTFGFLFDNEFVTAYDSFITRSPSVYQIETLTETILWKISFEDLQEVYEKTEKGNLIGRRMAENMYLIKSRRELSLLSRTAEERYFNLF